MKKIQCPQCGAPAATLRSAWLMGGEQGIVMGMFICTSGHLFRAKIGTYKTNEEKKKITIQVLLPEEFLERTRRVLKRRVKKKKPDFSILLRRSA